MTERRRGDGEKRRSEGGKMWFEIIRFSRSEGERSVTLQKQSDCKKLVASTEARRTRDCA